MQDFKERFKVLRQNAGLTQEDVAKRLGISSAVVSHWETGYREPSVGLLRKAAALFDVTMDMLYAGEPLALGHACPFCGSEVTTILQNEDGYYSMCEICSANGPLAPSSHMALMAGRARGNCMEIGGMEFTDPFSAKDTGCEKHQE